MCKIEKNAVKFAKEMIEHGYLGTMSPDDIVNKSCEMAYKIHTKAKSYNIEPSEPKMKDIEKMVHKIVSQHKESPQPIQH